MTITPVILYVEDDRHSRKLMEILLKGRMHIPEVTIFEDSRDFAAQVEKLDPKPNLILLDIHVNPYNGFQMLEMLNKLSWRKNARIVALTASVMSEEVQKLREIGFDGCLSKPIDLETFPETLSRILDGDDIWRIFT